MAKQQIDIHKVLNQDDGSVLLVFQPPEDPNSELPCAHVIPPDAYRDRAERHGYDVNAPDFHEKVTRHCLHEAHTPAPDHIKEHPRYMYGVVTDLAVADDVIEWKFKPEHVKALKKVKVPKGRSGTSRAV